MLRVEHFSIHPIECVTVWNAIFRNINFEQTSFKEIQVYQKKKEEENYCFMGPFFTNFRQIPRNLLNILANLHIEPMELDIKLKYTRINYYGKAFTKHQCHQHTLCPCPSRCLLNKICTIKKGMCRCQNSCAAVNSSRLKSQSLFDHKLIFVVVPIILNCYAFPISR